MAETHLLTENCWKLGNTDKVFLEQLIFRLMNWNLSGISNELGAIQSFVQKSEITHLCRLAVKSFSQQNPFLEIGRECLPITICADLHGQFFDLRRIMNKCGLPPVRTWLFLGDYVDRAKFGVETFCLLIAFKILYPTKCFMLRGNHEEYNVNVVYGFFDECIEKYGDLDQHLVFLSFVNVFNHMPVVALVNQKILAMHGGLSPELRGRRNLDELLKPSFIPAKGLMCDLVWSDPDSERPGWSTNNRSVSFCYDASVIEQFCSDQCIHLIVRGHQIKNEYKKTGYHLLARGKMVTIFSAPNYGGHYNTAAVLNVSEKMVCQFQLFRPKKHQKKKSH